MPFCKDRETFYHSSTFKNTLLDQLNLPNFWQKLKNCFRNASAAIGTMSSASSLSLWLYPFALLFPLALRPDFDDGLASASVSRVCFTRRLGWYPTKEKGISGCLERSRHGHSPEAITTIQLLCPSMAQPSSLQTSAFLNCYLKLTGYTRAHR